MVLRRRRKTTRKFCFQSMAELPLNCGCNVCKQRTGRGSKPIQVTPFDSLKGDPSPLGTCSVFETSPQPQEVHRLHVSFDVLTALPIAGPKSARLFDV